MTTMPPVVPSQSREAQTPDWLFTSQDVATILGISRQQVLREVAAGRLLYDSEVRRRCRTWRSFTAQNIRDYLRDWCKPPFTRTAEDRLGEYLAS